MTKSHLKIIMKKCKTCFYSTACMAFEELNITGEEAACENHLDKSMVVVLPCPIGTIVYEKYKDCEHCSNYHEVPYSDYVNCEEDNNLYDVNPNEAFHDDEKECKNHIKTRTVTFNMNMVSRFGKDIFLTENVAFVDVPEELTHLAGHQYGKTVFNSIKGQMDYDNPITFVFPGRITHIATSFIQGFFEEIMNHWCAYDLQTKMYVISGIQDLKQIFIDDLM